MTHSCKIISRWVAGLFRHGYHNGIEDLDILDVLPEDSSIKLSTNLGKYVKWSCRL